MYFILCIVCNNTQVFECFQRLLCIVKVLRVKTCIFQEVEVLKQELELCEKQLSAKYKAIQILQGHILTVSTIFV